MKSLRHNQNRVPRTESEQISASIVIVARKLDWFYAIE
jgi:hypothetical protein